RTQRGSCRPLRPGRRCRGARRRRLQPRGRPTTCGPLRTDTGRRAPPALPSSRAGRTGSAVPARTGRGSAARTTWGLRGCTHPAPPEQVLWSLRPIHRPDGLVDAVLQELLAARGRLGLEVRGEDPLRQRVEGLL